MPCLSWGYIISKSAVWLLSSLSHNTSCLLNLGNIPLVSLLNRSIPWLGSPGLIRVDLICNKATYMSACFVVLLTNIMHASTCYCFDSNEMMMQHNVCWVACRSFKLLWYEVCGYILHYLAGQPVFRKDNLIYLYQIIWTGHPSSFSHCELDTVICNAKTVLVINVKDVSSDRFSWHCWYFMWYHFVLGLWCLEIKTCRAVFHCLFYVSINADPVDGFTYHNTCLLNAHIIYVQLAQCIFLEWCWYYYSFAFHCNTINYHSFISEWQIWL